MQRSAANCNGYENIIVLCNGRSLGLGCLGSCGVPSVVSCYSCPRIVALGNCGILFSAGHVGIFVFYY